MSVIDAESVIVDLLARGHAVRFRARGHSMHPIIRCDDYLLVEPMVEPASRIERGDVVLMLAERGLTAHRVVRVDDQNVITRGDNAPDFDPPIDRARILGRVTHAERDGRMRRVRRVGLVMLAATRLAVNVGRALARRLMPG